MISQMVLYLLFRIVPISMYAFHNFCRISNNHSFFVLIQVDQLESICDLALARMDEIKALLSTSVCNFYFLKFVLTLMH